MDYYSGYITRLIEELAKLPGIGPKTAGRLGFHILEMPDEDVEDLAKAIINAKKNIKYCKHCYTLTDREVCPICASEDRNHKVIMVVESTKDMSAYESVGEYNGVYHVLHGVINPLAGMTQNDIKLKELFERLKDDVDEVIIATNSSVEGEATAMYISKVVKPLGIKVSRIASGVPVGGDLENIDNVTLLRALQGRITI